VWAGACTQVRHRDLLVYVGCDRSQLSESLAVCEATSRVGRRYSVTCYSCWVTGCGVFSWVGCMGHDCVMSSLILWSMENPETTLFRVNEFRTLPDAGCR